MTDFIPGLDLAEGYYRDVVAPILAETHPDLPHAAALIGDGSEVLGFDTEMSMDHHWGPRLQLFVGEGCDEGFKRTLSETLAARLPYEYRGFSTNFHAPRAREQAVLHMALISEGPVNHLIEITTLKDFSKKQLGFNASHPLGEEEWLAIPQQKLLSIAAGRVFHDDVGLGDLRDHLAWYPREVWLFLLCSTWWRLRREERVVGRVGMGGDELGAGIIAARIVRNLMGLGFAMERKYTPYSKWLGKAFGALDCAKKLGPQLESVLASGAWRRRDKALVSAYETVAKMHNELGLTQPIPAKCQLFRDQPYHLIVADRFGRALFSQIQSPRLKQLFKEGVVGNIDLITDSVDVTNSMSNTSRVWKLFEGD